MSSITELPIENLQYLYELAINEYVVTDMSYAFELLGHIKTIDLSYIDTSSVTNMSYIFFEDSDLETVEGVLDLTNCINYSNMFSGCISLKEITVHLPDTITKEQFISESKIESNVTKQCNDQLRVNYFSVIYYRYEETDDIPVSIWIRGQIL